MRYCDVAWVRSKRILFGFDIMMMLTKAARTLVLIAEAARMIQRPREEKSDSPFFLHLVN
jgi:hypothetical protein